MLDTVCALLRFPFEDTALEFSQLTSSHAATWVVTQAYRVIHFAVQVRDD